MTVIHHNFGGGSPPPASLECVEPLTAEQLATIGRQWITDALDDRKRMPPAARKAEAEESLERVHQCFAVSDDPRMWTVILGRHAWRARILLAED